MEPLSYLGSGLNMPGATQPGPMPGGMGGQVAPPAGSLPPLPPPMGLPPGAMGGMGAGMIPPPPAPPPTPADMKYEAVTQVDGSVLLHLKGPDGSLGPAVKIIPAPKSGAPKSPQQPPM